jgi:dihydropteroate synthase
VSARYRPVVMTGPARPEGALRLAGGRGWFTTLERLERRALPVLVDQDRVPPEVLERLTAPRAPLAGLSFERARIMGILNVTPDSFSDGGLFAGAAAAQAQARAMAAAGADIIDVGGESTRPGAQEVAAAEEIARTAPVIAAIRGESAIAVSIDTRKAAVARAALAAGAGLVNDVAALTHDPALAGVVAEAGCPVILMHAQGTPATMQDDPRYDDVVLDVYDFLEARIAAAEAAGIARERIIVDPGIGFGKTLQHNVRLLQALAVYHGLGCAILLGASRKRFIGTLAGAAEPGDRVAGSVAVALHAVTQGVQVLRVHDVKETRQALSLQEALGRAVE